MADKNRIGGNQSNQDWDQNRDRYNREGESGQYRDEDYGQGGSRMQQWSSRKGDVGYSGDSVRGMGGQEGYGSQQGWGRQQDYNRANYIPDNDQNRGYRDRDYEQSGYGTSGSRGEFGQGHQSGGYSGMSNQRSFGTQMNQGSDYGRQDWERQDWGRQGWGNAGNSNYGSYDDRGRNYGDRNWGNQGGYGNTGGDYNQYREGGRYREDDRNWGNSYNDRGDRGWWERTKDKVSSWFGDDDDRRDRMDRSYTGSHRGKGPKDYRRSEERIHEDVCDRLTEDDRVDASNIQIQVQGDEVILSGTVSNRDEKRRAEDLVERISGVRNVENRIRVGRMEEASNRTVDYGGHEYTGNTSNTGGIGDESGTTREIIRNEQKKKGESGRI